jgi:hypothetical protein
MGLASVFLGLSLKLLRNLRNYTNAKNTKSTHLQYLYNTYTAQEKKNHRYKIFCSEFDVSNVQQMRKHIERRNFKKKMLYVEFYHFFFPLMATKYPKYQLFVKRPTFKGIVSRDWNGLHMFSLDRFEV